MIDYVNVFTTDIARSEKFYRDVLGFAPGMRYAGAPGLELDAGNVVLALFECGSVGIEFQPNIHPMAIGVADVAAEQKRLEALGVKFYHTLDSGVCRMAFFNDPDGNVLVLHHRYAPEDAD